MERKKPELSIIILSFNTKDVTLSCLASLVSSYTKEDAWEIIIVDNASTDGSVAAIEKYIKESSGKMPPVRMIQNGKNVGFAAGNNCGINVAKGEWILLLNSDTEVHGDALQQCLVRAKEIKNLGAATVKVTLSSGAIDPACHRGFPTPWASFTYFIGLERVFPHSPLFSQYHMGDKDLRVAHEVDAITGAFFLFPSQIVSDVGLLDEDFFMYGEDLDYAYRIKKKGYSIWFFPIEGVLHKKKQSGRRSGKKELTRQTNRAFYETMILFYKKHYEQTYSIGITKLIELGVWCRMQFI